MCMLFCTKSYIIKPNICVFLSASIHHCVYYNVIELWPRSLGTFILFSNVRLHFLVLNIDIIKIVNVTFEGYIKCRQIETNFIFWTKIKVTHISVSFKSNLKGSVLTYLVQMWVNGFVAEKTEKNAMAFKIGSIGRRL